jgi:Holliday junction resolvase RusA-like endonuclease
LHKINIKPLSVNLAWQGKRFKTPHYNSFEAATLLSLPKRIEIPEGPLRVIYEFGLSNASADYDNPIKTFQDVLQKKYGFNDKNIMLAVIKKVIVKKGSEYIKFGIWAYEEEAA